MKPFRRTQVITLMTASAISTAWGQPTAPPAPAAARAQVAPPPVTAPPAPAAAKAGWLDDAMRESLKVNINQDVREETIRMALDAARGVQGGIYKGLEGGIADIARARAQAEIARYKIDAAKYSMELAQQIGPAMPSPKAFNFNYGGTSYEGGKSALDNHNYERAVEIFDKLINSKNQNGRVEGAYYWKAYALNKLGKRDEALAALSELAKQYPQSSWLNDSKALQAEVRQANGQPVSPETQADEDLKLYAINALINSDSERAVPLLEGLLSNPKMSPRLKERSLFVLAQSRSDKAHDIVGHYAKSGSNPDLQLVSVQYLGTYRSKESRQILAEVYSSASDVNVKRAVLRSFENSRDVEHLAAITKSEQNVELRREAIRQLGNLRDEQAVAGLVAAYSSESDRSIKGEILNSLANQGAVKQMIDCARKESDPELKKTAIRRLGEMKSKEALDFIAELLK